MQYMKNIKNSVAEAFFSIPIDIVIKSYFLLTIFKYFNLSLYHPARKGLIRHCINPIQGKH